MSPNKFLFANASKGTHLKKALSSQEGSALVIGIFVITVMFLMATSLMNVLEDADEQVNLEVWGTRAFATANTGADRALAQLFPLTATDNTATSCSNVTSSWDIGNDNPTLVGFHGCSIAISCNDTNTIGTVTQYRITSTATCQTGNCTGNDVNCLRVSRSVEVEARD
ncbi:MSHA biogenesis protein MshP [Shewanella sp. D64]|uniref:MSHA biogenesis protein MshP n=1 Tax=unclassified Shewanella TaxID=196818 RepID=UPI0022BA34B3|nr:MULTISPECIES: MSHA biogenesis protein MshP [unclassified Shewanella]MEC4725452.1 MSHA biogenesis protein MshP [Shewanella sp. D64]MEC4738729.1 MSHA biogenesis protein MshP [Shewanella sp. E94]WBJ95023.1 MSHA biogenesis protein MshP [Shewanella sp. MTB7]